MSIEKKEDNSEKIKSAYIYNIIKFIEWPKTSFNFSMSPFTLGVFKDNEIAPHLTHYLKYKKIKDRDWKFELFNTPEEIKHCHLVFFNNLDISETEYLTSYLKDKHILTIGYNIKKFCNFGGMINLVESIPNLGFEINHQNIKNEGLKVSSELLDLATLIRNV